MASIQGVDVREDGAVVVIIKHQGEFITARMSPDKAMKVFVDMGVAIDKARDIWNARKAELF